MAQAVTRFSDLVVATSDNPRTEDPEGDPGRRRDRPRRSLRRVAPDALRDLAQGSYTMLSDRQQAIDVGDRDRRSRRHGRHRRQGPRGLPDHRPNEASPSTTARKRCAPSSGETQSMSVPFSGARRRRLDRRQPAARQPRNALCGSGHRQPRRSSARTALHRDRRAQPRRAPLPVAGGCGGSGGACLIAARTRAAAGSSRRISLSSQWTTPRAGWARLPKGTARSYDGPVVAITGQQRQDHDEGDVRRDPVRGDALSEERREPEQPLRSAADLAAPVPRGRESTSSSPTV